MKALVGFVMVPSQKYLHFQQGGSRVPLRPSASPKSVFPVPSGIEDSIEERT